MIVDDHSGCISPPCCCQIYFLRNFIYTALPLPEPLFRPSRSTIDA